MCNADRIFASMDGQMRALTTVGYHDYSGCVSPFTLHFRRNVLHAGGSHTVSCWVGGSGSSVRGFVVLGICGTKVRSSVSRTTLTVTTRLKCAGRICERWRNPFMGQPGTLSAPYWPRTKRCRTYARRWNVGSCFGKMGEMFFQLLHNDPFAKHWYCDSESNKLCTLRKKRNPLLESSPKWGLQFSRVEASPSESCSIGEAVMSLVAEERIRQLFVSRGHSEREGIDSMSSGSMSLTWVKCGAKGILLVCRRRVN